MWHLQDNEALLFDCDGTLADTMPAHYRAWLHMAEHHGLQFDEDDFYAMGGRPTDAIVQFLADEAGISVNVAAAAAMKEDAFLREVKAVEPILPVIEVVRRSYKRVPMAVVTGGYQDVCQQILTHLGIRDYFDDLVASEDTERHKPFPDPYLEAADRLGVNPEKCVVWEDSDLGVEAARRAGMQWIDVRAFHQPKRMT